MGSQPEQTNNAEELVRELRQSCGLGASFFRAAAARIEMTDTDVQVIDILESTGEATAGQLANLMGLTTGTFTAILNRLEKAKLVVRERDPNDGRRVIVKLATGSEIKPLFTSLGQAWEEMANSYNDEQRAFLLEFLQRSNTLARDEIMRLRESPVDNEGGFSASRGDLKNARLVFPSEGVRLSLHTGELADTLYQAHFEGPQPEVKVKDGVVTIRYPRRLWTLGMPKRVATVTLNTALPWSIAIRSRGSEVTAELGGLDLLEMEANGAGSLFRIALPEVTRVVPIQLGGSGSEFIVRRPVGVAARVQLKGWGSGVNFDNEISSELSSDGRVQSPNYAGAVQRYDIEMSGSGSMITVTAG